MIIIQNYNSNSDNIYTDNDITSQDIDYIYSKIYQYGKYIKKDELYKILMNK